MDGVRLGRTRRGRERGHSGVAGDIGGSTSTCRGTADGDDDVEGGIRGSVVRVVECGAACNDPGNCGTEGSPLDRYSHTSLGYGPCCCRTDSGGCASTFIAALAAGC